MNIKVLEEQVAQQALLAEQAEQAAQQAREARAKAEQELLEAMVKAEQAEAEAQVLKAEAKSKSVRAMKLPRVDTKIMERSYQRAGVVGGGTLLSSGARQATVTFKPGTFRLLELAAADNRVSLSEIVRQLVDRGLNPRD
jgi:multidrug efflux pump subunit AcrA (membrane-fusion protein)